MFTLRRNAHLLSSPLKLHHHIQCPIHQQRSQFPIARVPSPPTVTPTPGTSGAGAGKGGVAPPFCGGTSVCSDFANRSIQWLTSHPNDMHHVFGQGKHNWNLTGLSETGNLDLIGRVIDGNYSFIQASDGFVQIRGNFGLYYITVRGYLDPTTGIYKVSTAWVNAGTAR